MVSASARAKKVNVLDRSATVTGKRKSYDFELYLQMYINKRVGLHCAVVSYSDCKLVCHSMLQIMSMITPKDVRNITFWERGRE
jgi:hypothetical protein